MSDRQRPRLYTQPRGLRAPTWTARSRVVRRTRRSDSSMRTRSSRWRGCRTLGHPDQGDKPFILVLVSFFRDQDKGPQPIMAPFAHIGIEMPSKEMVDEIANITAASWPGVCRGHRRRCPTRSVTSAPSPIPTATSSSSPTTRACTRRRRRSGVRWPGDTRRALPPPTSRRSQPVTQLPSSPTSATSSTSTRRRWAADAWAATSTPIGCR